MENLFIMHWAYICFSQGYDSNRFAFTCDKFHFKGLPHPHNNEPQRLHRPL